MPIFLELAAILVVATMFAMVMRYLKQPLIVGYILAGIYCGPYVLNIIHSTEHIELFSKIGITVLLFIIGLSLSPRVIQEVGKVSLLTGVGQVVVSSAIGFVIALLLGIHHIAALYVSIALTFSSTIIVLKLLSDRGDIHTLYGRITIGFLLIQDIIATIILLLVSSLAQSPDLSLSVLIFQLIVKGALITAVLYTVNTYLLPGIIRMTAESTELLFLFSLSWGLGMAALFSVLGFSVEIGALIAGVTLAATPFSVEIASRLKPLRDFFIILFFVLLGSQMVLDNVGGILIPGIILSLFVLIGHPVIVIIIMNLLGYKRRVGFMAGLTAAQISEFSLILAALGFDLGHLNRDTLSLITLVGLITIAGSTYFILYAETIYESTKHLLAMLELKTVSKRRNDEAHTVHSLLLFGYGRAGQSFVHALRKLDQSYAVVDCNPDVVAHLEEAHIPALFGDAQDAEFLEEIHVQHAKLVVSTIPEVKTNILLTRMVKQANKKAIVLVLAHHVKDAQRLYEAGATYVMMPHYLSATYVAHMITRHGIDHAAFIEEQEKHIAHLQKTQH